MFTSYRFVWYDLAILMHIIVFIFKQCIWYVLVTECPSIYWYILRDYLLMYNAWNFIACLCIMCYCSSSLSTNDLLNSSWLLVTCTYIYLISFLLPLQNFYDPEC
jgi:hypothetical protein